MRAQGPDALRLRVKRRKAGALIACLASPVTAIAALSGAIAPVLGVSESSLLAADMGLAAAMFVLVLWVARS